jgi:hypothetical protein
MSELKVNSIKGTGASTAAITIDSSSGGCSANITNNLTNRNKIINGAMLIAQRGTSSTSTGYQTVDRLSTYHGGTDEAPTYSQADVAAGTTPYSLGFRKCFKITNGNQTSGAGASDEIQVDYGVEAQDIANSGWDYTSASSFITLSYWVKSSVAQEFKGHILTKDGTQYNFPYSLGSLSADTWTKVIIKIPGNPNLQIDNDNGNGLQINLFNQMGTGLTGNVTEDTWATFSASTRTQDQTLTWYTTNDATFEITGVQLEVGSVATDFEHRTFAQELLLCRRYCNVWKSKNATKDYIIPAKVTDGDDAYTVYDNPVQFRSTPSIVISSADHIKVNYGSSQQNGPVNFSNRNFDSQYENRLFLNFDLNSNVLTSGDMVFLAFTDNTADGVGTFTLDAEL